MMQKIVVSIAATRLASRCSFNVFENVLLKNTVGDFLNTLRESNSHVHLFRQISKDNKKGIVRVIRPLSGF